LLTVNVPIALARNTPFLECQYPSHTLLATHQNVGWLQIKMNQRWTTGVKVYQCLAGLDGYKQLDTVGHLKEQSDNKMLPM